jgi:uncharacterized protein YndB with AHSA1/START domain
VDATTSDEVVREVHIAARPETVFAFFVDAEKLVEWIGLHAELEPRPGGLCRIDMNGKDVARGEFVEVVPYRRVVFTWGWEGATSAVPPGSSTVEVTLVPDGPNTLVRLRHFGLPVAQQPLHAEGWTYYLGRLAEAGERGRDQHSKARTGR